MQAEPQMLCFWKVSRASAEAEKVCVLGEGQIRAPNSSVLLEADTPADTIVREMKSLA